MDRAAIAATLDRAEAICHARGARLTVQRRQVLELVLRAGRPVGAYELLDALRRESAGAAPPTVYRALDFLIAHGLVHRIETLHAFVGCDHPGEPHASQFLICSECGAVREVEDLAVRRSVLAAADATGFCAEHPVVEVRGRCARCAESPR
jgi:Fur family zinc uptake transcriptional regulator